MTAKTAPVRGPRIRIPPPGPKARAALARDAETISPSYTRSYPLVAESAKDMFVTDVDGNRFLDFTSGVGVCVVGHCNPHVNRAAARQMGQLTHMCLADFYYERAEELARRLCEITPGKGPKKVFLSNSGTEAVEAAIKLARYATRRPRFLAFLGGFHGRTMGALSLTASRAVQREHFSPLLSEVVHVPFPYPYRCVFRCREGCDDAVISYIEEWIFGRVCPARDVAAVVVEPIQGEGGYVVPPPGFLPKLRELCDRHGILLIADEVQSGLGRTGKWFAIDHAGVVPDILCVAKALANGLPLGATIARADLHTWGPGAHANTFGGNPVACAAALATLDLIESRYMENARQVGAYLAEGLDRLTEKHDAVGEHRGVGLMRAIEIVEDRRTRQAAPDLRNRIVQSCFENGLLLLGCGPSSIRFLPPLTVRKDHVDMALSILDRAMSTR